MSERKLLEEVRTGEKKLLAPTSPLASLEMHEPLLTPSPPAPPTTFMHETSVPGIALPLTPSVPSAVTPVSVDTLLPVVAS
ncbi:hypothetical protein Q3G72_003916 [Acer saccharum]|nr:hypothetical protein Q3G72_003916 [Acer saccharum]